LTVTGSNGCTASASASVTLNNTPPTAGVTPSTATLTCANPTTSLTASGGVSYAWSNGLTTSSITASSANTYVVTVTAANGCTATASAVVSSGSGFPNAAISPPSGAITCVSTNINLSATGGDTYLWSTGSTSSSISVTSANTYSVTVTDTSNGCSASASAVITLTPGVNISVIPVNTTCGNNNGSADASNSTGSGQLIYTWSNGLTTSAISNLSAGIYTLTVNDALNCSATATFTINSSNAGSVNLTAIPDTICSQDSSLVCAPAGYVSYLWNTGETTSCIYAKQAGNYRVSVTDAGNCVIASAPKAVMVYPVSSVSIIVNGDTLSSVNGVAYQWLLNSVEISGAISSVYVATVSGVYQVKVTDNKGCEAVSSPAEIIVTSVENINPNTKLVKVYPNPTESNIWYLETDKELISNNFELFDATGKSVLKSEILNTNFHFDFPGVKGIYFLKIYSNNGTIVMKLIKL